MAVACVLALVFFGAINNTSSNAGGGRGRELVAYHGRDESPPSKPSGSAEYSGAPDPRPFTRNGARRLVYVDLGANWANTLRLYEDLAPEGLAADPSWEIYSFEANPLLQPWVENSTNWLNGGWPQPFTRVPQAGSTKHLKLLAKKETGCTGEGESFAACVAEYYKNDLQLVTRGMRSDPGVVRERLATAASPNHGSRPRFVFVPAGAAGQPGTLTLPGKPTAIIRGGGATDINGRGVGGATVTSELVDVASWLVEHFSERDYVILKCDIEGAERSLLEKLRELGGFGLIDLLAWECHHHLLSKDWCMSTADEIRAAGVTVLHEGQEYEGWDRYHRPPP